MLLSGMTWGLRVEGGGHHQRKFQEIYPHLDPEVINYLHPGEKHSKTIT